MSTYTTNCPVQSQDFRVYISEFPHLIIPHAHSLTYTHFVCERVWLVLCFWDLLWGHLGKNIVVPCPTMMLSPSSPPPPNHYHRRTAFSLAFRSSCRCPFSIWKSSVVDFFLQFNLVWRMITMTMTTTTTTMAVAAGVPCGFFICLLSISTALNALPGRKSCGGGGSSDVCSRLFYFYTEHNVAYIHWNFKLGGHNNSFLNTCYSCTLGGLTSLLIILLGK